MEFVGSAGGLQLTQAGRLVGTPAYMAPEQHAGAGLAKVGARTDQFAFAVSLYESLYRDLPFEGEFLDEVYWNIRKGRVTEPPRDSEVPTWVFRIIKKALSSEPDDRYPSMQALLAALRDDPSKRRRRVAVVAGGASLGVLGMFGIYQAVWGSEEPQLCRGAEEKLAGVWDDAAQRSVRDALLATEVPYAQDAADRVATELDDYARAWTQTRTSVCEATRMHAEQSEAVLDVRMACLDQRLSELGALARVLSEADDRVTEHAVTAAAGLSPLEECAVATVDGRNALPEDPVRREAVAAVQQHLGEVRALTMTGLVNQAWQRAEEASKQARAVGHAPLIAAALQAEGRARREAGQLDVSRKLMEEAIVLAADANDPDSEADAWLELVYVTGYLQGQPEVARSMRVAAEAAIRRRGSRPRDQVVLALNMGAVETSASEFAEARQWFEHALELATQHLGARDKDTATALRNLAVVDFRLGDTEPAIENFERALEITTDLFGTKHPDVAQAAFNLGNALSKSHPQRAAKLYEQALAIREDAFGSDSVKVAQVLNSLGSLQRQSEQRELARSSYERALAVFRTHRRPIPDRGRPQQPRHPGAPAGTSQGGDRSAHRSAIGSREERRTQPPERGAHAASSVSGSPVGRIVGSSPRSVRGRAGSVPSGVQGAALRHRRVPRDLGRDRRIAGRPKPIPTTPRGCPRGAS